MYYGPYSQSQQIQMEVDRRMRAHVHAQRRSRMNIFFAIFIPIWAIGFFGLLATYIYIGFAIFQDPEGSASFVGKLLGAALKAAQ